MKSEIYSGKVLHHRLAPVDHRFDYSVYFYAIDLTELSELDRTVAGFGYNRSRVVSIHDRDYLDPGDEPIAEKVRARFRESGVRHRPARIVLVTSARYFGYVFNPVSFYIGLDHHERPVCALAEVNNTFGDRHLYVLPDLYEAAQPSTAVGWAAKAFHVSPFNDMQGEYIFVFRYEQGAMEISIDMEKEGKTVFRASIEGTGRELTAGNMFKTLSKNPASAVKTMPRIMKQAAKLHYRKGLPIHHRPEPVSPMTIVRRPPSAFQRFAVRQVTGLLSRVRNGQLTLVMPDGSEQRWGDATRGESVTLFARRYSFFTRLVLGGAVGFGEAYTSSDLDCSNITSALRLLIANREILSDGKSLTSRLGRALNRVRHILRSNTRANSRKNIHEHYDLSNDFFRLFLDRTMTYSCARFLHEEDTLEKAQKYKLRNLIHKARIEPHHHILEIGSGWGSFAMETARTAGCRVTSITVSEEQYRLATERVRNAGLEDRVEIRMCDYRDVEGQFDRIVSIEMLEAVGHEHLPEFFKCCNRLLKPDGLLVLQVITIPYFRYDTYRRSCDWIQKHIFPGGHLPSLGAINGAMARATSFYVEAVENIGPHYAHTLQMWREAFLEKRKAVEAMGFDDEFIRKWEFYLAYCEAGFDTRTLNTLQLVVSRPNNVAGTASVPGRARKDEPVRSADPVQSELV